MGSARAGAVAENDSKILTDCFARAGWWRSGYSDGALAGEGVGRRANETHARVLCIRQLRKPGKPKMREGAAVRPMDLFMHHMFVLR